MKSQLTESVGILKELLEKVQVVRYTKVHVWVNWEDLSAFLSLTGCKRVDFGANVITSIADSEEIFADCRVINKSRKNFIKK